MGTDLWMSGNGDTHPTLTSYQNLSPTEAGVDLFWEKLYTAINLVNAGINRIDAARYTDATRKKTRLGELRFLRAFYYWHIVETWGGVHFTTQETNGIQTEANRTPVDTFYKQIFEDLDYAVANLPTTTPDYGRITKGGAEAFLARMRLTRGDWQLALTASTNVINNYGYRLVPVYADLWKMSERQEPRGRVGGELLDDARARRPRESRAVSQRPSARRAQRASDVRPVVRS